MMQPLTDSELRDFARQLGHKLTEPERDALVRVRNEANLALAQRANRIWKERLASYVAPTLDDAIDQELQEYIAKRKAELPDTFG